MNHHFNKLPSVLENFMNTGKSLTDIDEDYEWKKAKDYYYLTIKHKNVEIRTDEKYLIIIHKEEEHKDGYHYKSHSQQTVALPANVDTTTLEAKVIAGRWTVVRVRCK